MASGFIILTDGRCLSVRHKVHDAVVRSIAAAIDQAAPLADWLRRQGRAQQDRDLGHVFLFVAGAMSTWSESLTLEL